MKKILSFVILICLSQLNSCTLNKISCDIKTISDVKSKEYYLYIYSNSCPICQKITPEIRKIALKNDNFFLINYSNLISKENLDYLISIKDYMTEKTSKNYFKAFYVPLVLEYENNQIKNYLTGLNSINYKEAINNFIHQI